jgi:hypothetical protein
VQWQHSPLAILKTARARGCPRGFDSHTLRWATSRSRGGGYGRGDAVHDRGYNAPLWPRLTARSAFSRQLPGARRFGPVIPARREVRRVSVLGPVTVVSVPPGSHYQSPGHRDLQGDPEQHAERQQVQAAALPGEQADSGPDAEQPGRRHGQPLGGQIGGNPGSSRRTVRDTDRTVYAMQPTDTTRICVPSAARG